MCYFHRVECYMINNRYAEFDSFYKLYGSAIILLKITVMVFIIISEHEDFINTQSWNRALTVSFFWIVQFEIQKGKYHSKISANYINVHTRWDNDNVSG